MFWFILTGIIALAVVVIAVIDESGPFGQPIFAGVMATVIGGFAAFLFGCLLNIVGGFWTDTTWESDGRAELLALQDSTGSEGSFFLGTGSVDEEASFFYYEKLDYGAHLTHVDADDAIIVEEEGISRPYVEAFSGHTTNSFWFSDFLVEGRRWEFHIPEGSVVTNYSLDAK